MNPLEENESQSSQLSNLIITITSWLQRLTTFKSKVLEGVVVRNLNDLRTTLNSDLNKAVEISRNLNEFFLRNVEFLQAVMDIKEINDYFRELLNIVTLAKAGKSGLEFRDVRLSTFVYYFALLKVHLGSLDTVDEFQVRSEMESILRTHQPVDARPIKTIITLVDKASNTITEALNNIRNSKIHKVSQSLDEGQLRKQLMKFIRDAEMIVSTMCKTIAKVHEEFNSVVGTIEGKDKFRSDLYRRFVEEVEQRKLLICDRHIDGVLYFSPIQYLILPEHGFGLKHLRCPRCKRPLMVINAPRKYELDTVSTILQEIFKINQGLKTSASRSEIWSKIDEETRRFRTDFVPYYYNVIGRRYRRGKVHEELEKQPLRAARLSVVLPFFPRLPFYIRFNSQVPFHRDFVLRAFQEEFMKLLSREALQKSVFQLGKERVVEKQVINIAPKVVEQETTGDVRLGRIAEEESVIGAEEVREEKIRVQSRHPKFYVVTREPVTVTFKELRMRERISPRLWVINQARSILSLLRKELYQHALTVLGSKRKADIYMSGLIMRVVKGGRIEIAIRPGLPFIFERGFRGGALWNYLRPSTKYRKYVIVPLAVKSEGRRLYHYSPYKKRKYVAWMTGTLIDLEREKTFQPFTDLFKKVEEFTTKTESTKYIPLVEPRFVKFITVSRKKSPILPGIPAVHGIEYLEKRIREKIDERIYQSFLKDLVEMRQYELLSIPAFEEEIARPSIQELLNLPTVEREEELTNLLASPLRERREEILIVNFAELQRFFQERHLPVERIRDLFHKGELTITIPSVDREGNQVQNGVFMKVYTFRTTPRKRIVKKSKVEVTITEELRLNVDLVNQLINRYLEALTNHIEEHLKRFRIKVNRGVIEHLVAEVQKKLRGGQKTVTVKSDPFPFIPGVADLIFVLSGKSTEGAADTYEFKIDVVVKDFKELAKLLFPAYITKESPKLRTRIVAPTVKEAEFTKLLETILNIVSPSYRASLEGILRNMTRMYLPEFIISKREVRELTKLSLSSEEIERIQEEIRKREDWLIEMSQKQGYVTRRDIEEYYALKEQLYQSVEGLIRTVLQSILAAITVKIEKYGITGIIDNPREYQYVKDLIMKLFADQYLMKYLPDYLKEILQAFLRALEGGQGGK
ncbi:hypothetical protein [Candidatus Caldatribacterium sp.]|uniref:hypothetical protein n=1 Tax=Candidatus Caldatribacterium sp. TaxID=2282143 RepID=UPI0038450737|nr:hypothetical protein [Candidatus Caldatribacterium sp.]